MYTHFGIHQKPDNLRAGQETRFDYIFHNFITLQPFKFDTFAQHYKNHFKKLNPKFTDEDLKIFYKYTGGIPGYNRLLENTFDFKNTENLDQRIFEHISKPQALVVTKQLLADLDKTEVKCLISIVEKSNQFDEKAMESLKQHGLIDDKNKIVSKILEEDLPKLNDISSGIVIDQYTKRIFVNDVEVSIYLSPTEFKFLEFLYQNKGKVCDREEVIEYAWGGNPDGVSDEAIDQLVSRLRSKLTAKTGNIDLIKTIRGRGFILE